MERAERKRINTLLWQWGTALEDCERRREEIRRLMAQAEDATCVLRAQALTAMPRGSGVSDPTAAAVRMKDDALQRVAFYWRDEILDYLCSFLQDICGNI